MRHDTRLAVRNGPTISGVAFPFVLKRLRNTPGCAFKSHLHASTWSGSGAPRGESRPSFASAHVPAGHATADSLHARVADGGEAVTPPNCARQICSTSGGASHLLACWLAR